MISVELNLVEFGLVGLVGGHDIKVFMYEIYTVNVHTRTMVPLFFLSSTQLPTCSNTIHHHPPHV